MAAFIEVSDAVVLPIVERLELILTWQHPTVVILTGMSIMTF